MNEKQLITDCLNGNRKAQKELYDTYSPKMMGVCLRYVRDRETARDLLQEGFIRVFTSLKSYSGSGAFEGWIRTIFVNIALEHLRRTDVLRNSVDLDQLYDTAQADETVLSRITAMELVALIRKLPSGFRTVFNMYAVEGYSHKEIAEKLHIAESTSRSQYQRARRWLQVQIKRWDEQYNS